MNEFEKLEGAILALRKTSVHCKLDDAEAFAFALTGVLECANALEIARQELQKKLAKAEQMGGEAIDHSLKLENEYREYYESHHVKINHAWKHGFDQGIAATQAAAKDWVAKGGWSIP